MAEFAVVDEVDAGVALARYDVCHDGAQPGQVFSLVGEFPCRSLFVERDQVLWPWQAARVAGQDPVRHVSSLRFIREAVIIPR
jgi:hypothetical protein